MTYLVNVDARPLRGEEQSGYVLSQIIVRADLLKRLQVKIFHGVGVCSQAPIPRVTLQEVLSTLILVSLSLDNFRAALLGVGLDWSATISRRVTNKLE